MSYIYQLALRRKDDEKRQFIIENDMITTETMLDETFVKEIADKYQCDVQVTYLGELISPQVEQILEAEYHTKEMIEQAINEWQEKQREEFTDGQS
jgi:hypothetical protein